MRAILATDGSPSAQRAAARLGQLLRRDDHVVICTAAPPPDTLADAKATIEGEALSAAHQLLEQARGDLGGRCRHVRTLRLEGDAVPAICALAEAEGAELIAMGHRGLGDLASLVLGSVSHGVLQRTKAAVLLVK